LHPHALSPKFAKSEETDWAGGVISVIAGNDEMTELAAREVPYGSKCEIHRNRYKPSASTLKPDIALCEDTS